MLYTSGYCIILQMDKIFDMLARFKKNHFLNKTTNYFLVQFVNLKIYAGEAGIMTYNRYEIMYK